MFSADEKRLVVQKLEGPVYAKAGFNSIWNQVTGYGVPRQVEGFQTPTLASQAESALSTFFNLWNNFPTGFSKSADISGSIAKWGTYINADMSPYKGTQFNSLTSVPNISSFTVKYDYNNDTSNTTLTLTVIVNNTTYTFPNTINAQYYAGARPATTLECSQSGPAAGKYTSVQDGPFVGGGECFGIYSVGSGSETQTFFNRTTQDAVTGTLTNGSGTIINTQSLPVSTILKRLRYSYNLNTITTSNFKFNDFAYTNADTTITSFETLTNDFNNIYTALLIDLYTGINSRHSMNPPVPFTPMTYLPWNGPSWSALGSGLNSTCRALTFGPDGSLYAGGIFTLAGDISAAVRIARWNGSSWSALGNGLNNICFALTFGSDGSLYAGGDFTKAGDISAVRIARWNGSSWSALGSGLDNVCLALTFGPDGSLYAGGWFTTAGRISANRIARWNGSSWSALGTGLNRWCSNALTFGPSPDNFLYAGGDFTTAGGISASNIARWNGSSWSALGSGLDNVCRALIVGPDGSLYAGGDFTTAGGITVNYVAKWDGSSWSALGSGLDNVCLALTFGPDGFLYAGGSFTSAGGISATRIAKWDGSSWSALDSGLNNICYALTFGPSPDNFLYAGGTFTTAGDISASHIAMYKMIERENALTGVNTELIKNTYLSTHLSTLYISVYKQVNALISDIEGTTISTFSNDSISVRELPIEPNAETVIADLITMTNIYNRYSSQYLSIIQTTVYNAYIVLFNKLYKKAMVYFERSAFSPETNPLMTKITNYMSSTTTWSNQYTSTETTLEDLQTLRTKIDTAVRDVLGKLVDSMPTLGGNPSDFEVPVSVTTAITTPLVLPTTYSELEDFGNNVLEPFEDWTSAMQTYLKAYIDEYVLNATAAGIAPALDATTYKGYVDLAVAPWQVKPEETGTTKPNQLRAIYNIFRDANAAFEAVGKVRDFYNASYTAGARYLSATDMISTMYATSYASTTLTLQQVVAKCLNYLNSDGTTKNTTLQTGDASFSALLDLMNTANVQFATALIDRYFATLTTWQTRGVTRPAGIPTDGTIDKAALTAATMATTRTTYLGRWETLLVSLKTRTKVVLSQAKDLKTWKATATETSYTFVSNPSISSKGLGTA